MSIELLHLTALGVGLAVNAALQILTCRLAPRWGWLHSFFVGFLGGMAVLFALEGWLAVAGTSSPLQATDRFFAIGITYAALSFFYFNIINGDKSALRVRLLRELSAAPEGLDYENLLRAYSPDEMFATRIERLLGHGQVILRDGRYSIGKPDVIIIARILGFMKLLVMGKRSEFD